MTKGGLRGRGSDAGVLGTAVPLDVEGGGVGPDNVVVVHVFVVGRAISQMDDLWAATETSWHLVNSY